MNRVRKAKAVLEKNVKESEKLIRNNVKKASMFKISSVLNFMFRLTWVNITNKGSDWNRKGTAWKVLR